MHNPTAHNTEGAVAFSPLNACHSRSMHNPTAHNTEGAVAFSPLNACHSRSMHNPTAHNTEGAGAFSPLNAASQEMWLQPRALQLSCRNADRAPGNPNLLRNSRNRATPPPLPGHVHGRTAAANHPRLPRTTEVPPACLRSHARSFSRADHARSECFT